MRKKFLKILGSCFAIVLSCHLNVSAYSGVQSSEVSSGCTGNEYNGIVSGKVWNSGENNASGGSEGGSYKKEETTDGTVTDKVTVSKPGTGDSTEKVEKKDPNMEKDKLTAAGNVNSMLNDILDMIGGYNVGSDDIWNNTVNGEQRPYIPTDKIFNEEDLQNKYEINVSDNLDIEFVTVKGEDGFDIEQMVVTKVNGREIVEGSYKHSYTQSHTLSYTVWEWRNTTNDDWKRIYGDKFYYIGGSRQNATTNASQVLHWTLGHGAYDAGTWEIRGTSYYDNVEVYEYKYEEDYTRWIPLWDENGKPVLNDRGEQSYKPVPGKKEKTAYDKQEEKDVVGEILYYYVTVPTICATCPAIDICVGPEGSDCDCDGVNTKCDDDYYDEDFEYNFSGSLTN